jgi:hypothetical protein
MAESPAHRFGQIVGEVLESAIEPLLAQFAKKHSLYLDKKGERPCRPGKKCSWLDRNGNKHDLDFVLERGGSRTNLGIPAAFIETAWRRYTKHSRNKAQEIQGAIGPLVETYKSAGPFTGVILAGVFTRGALTQLESLGFTVLYFPYKTVVAVFGEFGIDAAFDEETPDADLQEKVDAYEAMFFDQRFALASRLLEAHEDDVRRFMAALEKVVLRQIERIVILPLHGGSTELATVDEAIKFIKDYNEMTCNKPLKRYEIQVRYNNGNVIEGKFKDKASAVEFLQAYQPLAPHKVK